MQTSARQCVRLSAPKPSLLAQAVEVWTSLGGRMPGVPAHLADRKRSQEQPRLQAKKRPRPTSVALQALAQAREAAAQAKQAAVEAQRVADELGKQVQEPQGAQESTASQAEEAAQAKEAKEHQAKEPEHQTKESEHQAKESEHQAKESDHQAKEPEHQAQEPDAPSSEKEADQAKEGEKSQAKTNQKETRSRAEEPREASEGSPAFGLADNGEVRESEEKQASPRGGTMPVQVQGVQLEKNTGSKEVMLPASLEEGSWQRKDWHHAEDQGQPAKDSDQDAAKYDQSEKRWQDWQPDSESSAGAGWSPTWSVVETPETQLETVATLRDWLRRGK